MTFIEVFVATLVWALLTSIVYTHTRWGEIRRVYMMWFTPAYWKPYNIIEALSWGTKAIIIVPGLIFGYSVWWFYFLTLVTSLTLIWASNKKLLPTLVAFNTLWVWISCMVISKHVLG